MNQPLSIPQRSLRNCIVWALFAFGVHLSAQAERIVSVQKVSPTMVQLKYANNQTRSIDFYGDQIFRMFQDPQNRPMRDPEASPEAKILVDQPRTTLTSIAITEQGQTATITTSKIRVEFNKDNGLMKVTNLKTNQTPIEQIAPVKFEKNKVSIALSERPEEYFYGGGVQNGRFSHKGNRIAIVNENSWSDGGVASPNPFYWSTSGYAIMCYTFHPGHYDFGAANKGQVNIEHETNYLDIFFMVDNGAVALLNDYYQLTGKPVLLPKFGFYEGHLNAYNRDYWKAGKEGNGMLVEMDGEFYRESQKDNGGIQESLNGEKNNYPFSARAVIDRYNKHDMPLGWILPNDGYGAGYGQTETLDGNIANLKEFGDYARQHGVEIGLWTQSDLHPIDTIKALLQRDIAKEIGVAGVRVLKTDVAWVGAGYSFGLNGIADAAKLMPQHGNNARPMIITLDGWAGTQRYGGVWSGDQTGGIWEYIRFHIPTYIGSGLAGMPNISSDMDGIFGGKNIPVNVRDFQWKTFTPMQLNMDGWGSNAKYPQALGEPATSINRSYLKFKSMLTPYIYSVAHESVSGQPMIRAMFLSDANSYTLGKATQYQYMFGPWFLVAPIYQATNADNEGNDIRDGIYLPKGQWIDYYSGETYEGGCILNNFDAPLWKLPLFVKPGAIIPMTRPNNNVSQIPNDFRMYELYPNGHSEYTEYDDDGKTQAYLQGDSATTQIISDVTKGNLCVTINPTKGSFNGMNAEKSTQFNINITQRPKSIKVKVGKKNIKLKEAKTLNEFNTTENTYFYEAMPELNQFSTPGSEAASVSIRKNPQLLVKVGKTNVTQNAITLTVKDYVYNKPNFLLQKTGVTQAPANFKVEKNNCKPYSLTPSWDAISNADYYEISFNGMTYTGIKQNKLEFGDLTPETAYTFKLRAVNKDGHSEWTELNATTDTDPFEFAIKGMTGKCTAKSQGGQGLNNLFDFDESTTWHSKYDEKASQFELTVDMHSVNTLEKMVYVPRKTGVNGIILKGKASYSMDKENWTEVEEFTWMRDNQNKVIEFKNKPTARYVKISVEKAYNDFGSGCELYIFKVPGTASYIPGDINNDNKLDENDLTSYMNYTGLRLGDKDFEGYVSKGDINKNNLIDAYDISNVAVEVDGGVRTSNNEEAVNGKLQLVPNKKTYKAGEEAEITVRGVELKNVNALSFAMAYTPANYEYLGVKELNMKKMENYTNDRLHSNGQKSLYPTFVNVGNQETLNGTENLFVLRFKVSKDGPFSLKMTDGILVDKNLISKKF